MLDAVAIVGLLARGVPAECHVALSLSDLPFNPLRLIVLIGWVYLCMYFVQRVNFSPLVPKTYRTTANLVTLFTGTFLLLTLFLIETARKSRETQESFLDILKRQLQHALVLHYS